MGPNLLNAQPRPLQADASECVFRSIEGRARRISRRDIRQKRASAVLFLFLESSIAIPEHLLHTSSASYKMAFSIVNRKLTSRVVLVQGPL